MADLHSHLLPGVDDGSKTPEQSIEVMQVMLSERVTDICLTPHLAAAELAPARLDAWFDKNDRAHEQLMAVAPSDPRLYRGSEIMLDQVPASDTMLTRRVSLAGSRYALVEFPTAFSSRSIEGLATLVVSRGLVPLLAHVERYAAATIGEVYRWRECGAAIQVDASTLAAGRGPRAQRARAIIEAGLADVIAADNHGDARTLGPVFNYLCERGGEAQADYLLRVNPQAILRDEAVEPVPPLKLVRTGLPRWIDVIRRN